MTANSVALPAARPFKLSRARARTRTDRHSPPPPPPSYKNVAIWPPVPLSQEERYSVRQTCHFRSLILASSLSYQRLFDYLMDSYLIDNAPTAGYSASNYPIGGPTIKDYLEGGYLEGRIIREIVRHIGGDPIGDCPIRVYPI